MISVKLRPVADILLIVAALLIIAATRPAAPTYTVNLPRLYSDRTLNRGVAIDNSLGDANAGINATGAGWGYNYLPAAGDDWPLGVQFIPFVWCNSYLDDALLALGGAEALAAGVSNYGGPMLWGNEPDAGGQCGGDMLKLLADLHAAFPRALLIGPNFAGPDGLADFINDAKAAGVPLPAGYGIHAYAIAEAHDHNTIIAEVAAAANVLSAAHPDAQLWLSEFGFNMLRDHTYTYDASLAERRAGELLQLLNWLDGAGIVTRYAYYAPRHNRSGQQTGWNHSRYTDLQTDTLTLTPVGRAYNNPQTMRQIAEKQSSYENNNFQNKHPVTQ